METTKLMEIDEEKQYGLYKIEHQNKPIKKAYSDDNAILINIDFICPKDVSRKKKVITRKGYKKYQTIIQEKEINKILEKTELQENYNTWVDEVENNIKQAEKIKIRKPRKEIRRIQQERKKLRMEKKTTKNKLEKHILLQRVKILKEHITGKLKESRTSEISKVAESIKNNVDNEGKIWEVKRKLKKKEQNPHQILNSQGQKIENKDEILKEYARYYKELLKNKTS